MTDLTLAEYEELDGEMLPRQLEAEARRMFGSAAGTGERGQTRYKLALRKDLPLSQRKVLRWICRNFFNLQAHVIQAGGRFRKSTIR